MLKSIVYLNADLPSSIALRYACRLAAITGMDINTLHVASTDTEGHPPGTGWVSRTWEKDLIQQAREKIVQLTNMEKNHCPHLSPPKILLGNPEGEILREMAQTEYGLFIVGLRHPFSPQLFFKQMHSKFYQQASCPILLVKNLVDIKRIGLLLESGEAGTAQTGTFLDIFNGAKVDVDLLSCVFTKTDSAGPGDILESAVSGAEGDSDKAASLARDALQGNGFTPGRIRRLQGRPKAVGDRLAEYDLLLTSLPHHIGPTSPLLDCLSRIPSALLFCREQ